MEKQIEQLYKPLYLYIRKRINNQMDAEDLTQEVFYKLSKSKNDKVENIKSWVYTIAKNTITDYYRKKKNILEEVNQSIFEEEYLTNDTAKEFAKCCIVPFINQLPETYRKIMIMSELEDIPQKEIAKMLDINYTTLRSKVQRGRQKLKTIISDCCIVVQGGKGSILDFKKNNGCTGGCK